MNENPYEMKNEWNEELKITKSNQLFKQSLKIKFGT